jgi:hypothetical protein
MGGKQRRARGKARIEHAALYQSARPHASSATPRNRTQRTRRGFPLDVLSPRRAA